MDYYVAASDDGLMQIRRTDSKRCAMIKADRSSQPAPFIFTGNRDIILPDACLSRTRTVGDLAAEFYCGKRKALSDYPAMHGAGLLLLPLIEPLRIIAPERCLTCQVGAGFLIVQDGEVRTVQSEDSLGLVLRLRTDHLNAAISAVLGEAHKFGSSTLILDVLESVPALQTVIECLLDDDQADERVQGDVADNHVIAFYEALARKIVDGENGNSVIRVRSVSDAMNIIQQDPGRAFETSELAALVGVTAQTLRKGFRASLGKSVKEYIQMVRLDRAHETLSSGRDSRTISEVAIAVGFARGSVFTRAYTKRFGEAPSHTRARVVRELEH